MASKEQDTSSVNGRDDESTTLTLKDGSRYVGEIEDGVAHGHGTIVLSDGREISGTFDRGMPHGSDIVLTFPDGRKYVGEYRHGRREGYGKMFFPDGDVYEGEWKNDRPHGNGVITHSDDSTERGRWIKGNRVRTGAEGSVRNYLPKIAYLILVLAVIGAILVNFVFTGS